MKYTLTTQKKFYETVTPRFSIHTVATFSKYFIIEVYKSSILFLKYCESS